MNLPEREAARKTSRTGRKGATDRMVLDWERVHVWSTTFYTLIQALRLAQQSKFGDLSAIGRHAAEAGEWIRPECSYSSTLLVDRRARYTIEFRRDPNQHFKETANQIVKMLVQDLTVILDEMMSESMERYGFTAVDFPQGKIKKLATKLDKGRYDWARQGCLELVAVRNALTHAGGLWNTQSIGIVEGFIREPKPVVGERLVVGFPMLFRYRKAMRTFLNETLPVALAIPDDPAPAGRLSRSKR